MNAINLTCKNIYTFIRLRLGTQLSDREIARRWPMEWKSFNGLKHGKRQVPRIADLEGLAKLLGIDAAFVFEVARGTSAELVHGLINECNMAHLSQLLLSNTLHAQDKTDVNASEVASSQPQSPSAAYLVVERDGTVTAVNRIFHDVASIPMTQATVGKSAFYLLDDFGGSQCPVTRAFESGRPEQDLVRRRMQSGMERMIHRCAQPILDESGDVLRVIEVDVDLTEAYHAAAPEMLEPIPTSYEHRRSFSGVSNGQLNNDTAQP